MIDFLNLDAPVDTSGFNYQEYFYSLPEKKQREILFQRQKAGLAAPTKDNIFVEGGQALLQGMVNAGVGLGSTLDEAGLGSGMMDYFAGVRDRNQHWGTPIDGDGWSYAARAVGGALGSTAATLAASAAGTLAGGPGVGLAAGLATGFATTFGENIKRNRVAGYGEDKALGMAFLESAVDTAIENLPWGIVGKGTKLAANMSRLRNISAAGKKELLNKIGQRIASQVGQKNAQNLLAQWAKKAAVVGLGESGEEGLQYLNTYINQVIGGDPNAEFSTKDFIDAMAQGFIGGFGIGGVMSIPGLRSSRKATAEPAAGNAQIDPAVKPLFESLAEDVGNAFGINVAFMDTLAEDVAQQKEDEANGFYDPESKTIFLNRRTFAENPTETLGHELKHWVDDNHPELSKAFDKLWQAGQTKEGKKFFKQQAAELGIAEDVKLEEFGAMAFGKIWTRPGSWESYYKALENQSPGMGERFFQVLKEFLQIVKDRLSVHQNSSPEAEQIFNNVAELEAEAGKMLAEIRRRNGTASQVENVVGVKGNTVVETVPVAQEEKVVVSETGKTTAAEVKEDVAGAENAQTTKEVVSKTENTTAPEKGTAEKAENDALQKMRDAFENRAEILNSTSKQMLWTDIAREYAEGQVLSKKANASILQEIINMAKEDYQWGESRSVLYAISQNPAFSKSIRKKAESAIKFIDKKIDAQRLEQVKDSAVVKENLTTETAATPKENLEVEESSENRESQDAVPKTGSVEETPEEKSAVDQRKAETYRYRSIAEPYTYYRRITDARKSPSGYENNPGFVDPLGRIKDNPEVGMSFNEYYTKIGIPLKKKLLASRLYSFQLDMGNGSLQDWEDAADTALAKAYTGYSKPKGASIQTLAGRSILNAIDSVNKRFKLQTDEMGGRLSLNQKNEEGEELIDSIAKEASDAEYDEVLVSKNTSSAVLRIQESNLDPVEKDIFAYYLEHAKLYPDGSMDPGIVLDAAKKFGLTPEKVLLHIGAIKEKAFQAGVRYSRKRGDALRKSIQERDKSLARIANFDMHDEISKVIESGIPEGKYVFRNQGEKQKIIDGAVKFLIAFSTKVVNLSDGRIAYFMPDKRAFKRGDATAWAEYGIHAVTSSGDQIPGKEYNERLFNQNKLDNLDRIIPIIQQENVFGKFDNKNPAKDGVIFVGTSHDGKRLEVITRLDEYGNPQADLTEVTVLATKKDGSVPPSRPLTEVVEAVAQHQAAGFSPSTNDNIPQSGEKSNNNLKFSRKNIYTGSAVDVDEHIRYSLKKRQQRNPDVRHGVAWDEWEDILERNKYTPQKLEELRNKAFEWIERKGGIVQAAEAFLNDKAPAVAAVAEVARRYIITSDVFINDVDYEDRVKLYEQDQDIGTSLGRALRARRADVLALRDIASVQAFLNRLHANMPTADVRKLRNQIMDEMGLDIYKLPKNIVDDKAKLDAVLRKHLATKASWQDKAYEYWINAILSGPSTHASNIFGNLANASYELGIKRFTEALVNSVLHKKDGATFGEFRQMAKAFNWGNAWKAMKQAYDREVLNAEGKYIENSTVSIDGKAGRIIRIPGRALRAADALAKALIEPMETAAYAYRLGVGQGLTGTALENFMQKELSNINSQSYQWGKKRGLELTFQEDPGSAVKYLMALRESGTPAGMALKFFLPFLKTPANILKQGIRKGPLGTLGLAFETGKAVMGKRNFDGEYISRVAEQLIAWGVTMALLGLDDDDEMPYITGTSARYGSPEAGFKANKMPPYSIRIGDTCYSYARIDPLATGLATMADGINSLRDIRRGKDATAVLANMLRNAAKVVSEKSYLDSIGEMVKVLENPELAIPGVASNLLASAMPNLVKQLRGAMIEEVGDNRSRNKGADWWRDQVDFITNKAGLTVAIPRIDYFGRPVKKDDWSNSMLSDFGRLLPMRRVEADSHMDNAERLIWNYNHRNPNEEYYPSLPDYQFTVNRKKMYFAGEDYAKYAEDAGKLAHKQILNAIRAGYLNVRNPDAADIDLIKKIFTRARKETRMKYLSKAKQK